MQGIKKLFDEFHYADIAEILDELDLEEAIYIIKLLDSAKQLHEILTWNSMKTIVKKF
jgi:Mg/Co/Ni transporter MgtE